MIDKKYLSGLLFIIFAINLQAAERCQVVYERTAQSFIQSAKEVTAMSITAPVLGAAVVVGSPFYYLGKGLNDLRIMVMGDPDENTPRLDALSRITIKNPRDTLAAMGTGTLAAVFGLPGGIIKAPALLRHGMKLHSVAKAFAELDQLDPNLDAINHETPLGPNLDKIYRRVNWRLYYPQQIIWKRDKVFKREFVDIFRRLVANSGLCPEGSTYTRAQIVSIIRGFHDNPDYRIPESIYRKTDWFQVPILEYIKNYRDHEIHTRRIRLAAAKRFLPVKRIYEGHGPALHPRR